MMDKYKDYSASDFLEDSNFLRWLSEPTPEDIEFWNAFLKRYPSQKEEIREATLIFKLFYSRESQFALSEQYELWKRIQIESKAPKKDIFLRVVKYAAILVLVFFSGAVSYYFYQDWGTKNQFQLVERNPAMDGEAMVILADGSKVSLEKQMSEISYSKNGKQLIVNNDTIQQKSGSLKESMNTVIVSYGKKSMIVLSDGTKVWLNAGSQLVYPAVFLKDTREVSLVGEAFFDVVKNPRKPFVVNSSDVKIRVLGTRFDISAYPEDKIIQTVLEEGKIDLKYTGNGIFKRDYVVEMEPNQMVEFDKVSRETNSSTVNVTKYISWKEGMLEFDKVALIKAMKQVERFYNVRIFFDDPSIGAYKLSGKLDLKDEPEKVLNVIKLTVPIDWQRKSNGDFIIINK
jgi:ferric-dicitrate binding protein FerR (iron transport regulator)